MTEKIDPWALPPKVRKTCADLEAAQTGGASATWPKPVQRFDPAQPTLDNVSPEQLAAVGLVVNNSFQIWNEPKPESILKKAEALVNGDRAKAYGHPRDNFKRIVVLWNAYISLLGGRELTEADHAVMMILVKVARMVETPDHMDSIVDLAGYAGTIERLLEK